MRSSTHEPGAEPRLTLASGILSRRMRLPRAQTRDVICRRDLPALMDDGAVLLADRWVARERADRPQPTVLVRSPYGRRQLVGLLFGRLLAERGLQVVIQSVRGTFGSGGTFSPFDERADGLATLRWLRAQLWHAGPVGTLGPSYLGFVQWAIADDDLAAMSIQVSASEFHGQTYAGSSLSLETLASWLVIVAMQERRLGLVAIDRALRGLSTVVSELPLTSLDERLTGAPVAWFQEGFSITGRDDPYWARRDFSRQVPDVTAPVSFVGGGRARASAAHRAMGPHLAGAGGGGGARRAGVDASPSARRRPARYAGACAFDDHRRAHRRRLARSAGLASARTG